MKKSNLVLFNALFILCMLGVKPVFAWNWVGHELIAQIAYDQLTEKEKQKITQEISAIQKVYFKKYSPKNYFIRASTLPDDLRKRKIDTYNTWHYINLPVIMPPDFIFKKRKLPPENILWAIKHIQNILEKNVKNKTLTKFQKSFYLSFLIHLVGDAHQPLHCAELYSANFPHGDRGGNLFKIRNRQYHNLHAYWDAGGGYLTWYRAKNSFTLEKMARTLEEKYPKAYFGEKINKLNPQTWINESYLLAKNKAYHLTPHTHPSHDYQIQTQTLTQEQIVLAGYRLASLMKFN